jgi:hypothetical protein
MRDLPRAHGGNMMIIRWMSAKARRRLKTLADGGIEERVL